MFKRIFCTVFMLLFVCLLMTSCTQRPRRKVISETFLDKINYAHWVEYSFYASPDMTRIAYEILETSSRTRLVVNGQKSKQTYSGIGSVMIRFSPDSQHLAYIARSLDYEKWVLNYDGKELKYAQVSRPTFSPDGQKFAFKADEGEESFIVINGQEGTRHTRYLMTFPIFSSNSQRLAYAIRKGEKYCLVVDGQEGKLYDKIDVIWEEPRFTPNNQSIVYVAQEAEKVFVVVNGEEDRRYDWIDNLIISPNSQKIAYIARRDSIWYIVVNGLETLPRYERPYGLSFSPDSLRMAYVLPDYTGKRCYVFVDGRAGKDYDSVSDNIVFSPDSRHIAYVADLDRERKCIVVDGQETALDYDDIEEDSLCFSPDSKHLAFAAKKGGQWFVVIGGKRGRSYEEIIMQSKGTGFRKHARIFFESPTRLRYLAKKDDSIYLIQEEIKG